MRTLIVMAAVAGTLASQAAVAQDEAGATSFRGFRLEGNVGGDRFSSERVHQHDKLGYGGSGGFDGTIGPRVVIGAEGSYWRPKNGSENCTSGINGSLCDKSLSEFGTAVRGGFLITPQLLVFGKGGFVRSFQRQNFIPSSSLFIVNGQISPLAPFNIRARADGYQLGGGAEFSLTKLFYVDGQYVFSQYDNHTYRQRVMAGVGIRFK